MDSKRLRTLSFLHRMILRVRIPPLQSSRPTYPALIGSGSSVDSPPPPKPGLCGGMFHTSAAKRRVFSSLSADNALAPSTPFISLSVSLSRLGRFTAPEVAPQIFPWGGPIKCPSSTYRRNPPIKGVSSDLEDAPQNRSIPPPPPLYKKDVPLLPGSQHPSSPIPLPSPPPSAALGFSPLSGDF